MSKIIEAYKKYFGILKITGADKDAILFAKYFYQEQLKDKMPSVEEIHNLADNVSLMDNTRDRSLYYMGIKRGLKLLKQKLLTKY